MSHTQCRFLCGEARGDALAVRFLGDELLLDEAYTCAAAAELSALARESGEPRFLVDLGNVAAVSTQTLGVLVMLRKRLLATGRVLTLCNLRPAVAELLATTRLDRLFPITRDERPLEPTSAGRPAAAAAVAETVSRPCPKGRVRAPGFAREGAPAVG